eukprot:gnl/TRDRNA2_/TRDRNA2_136279_c0_seq1.p1 gnl/TRDRNA2_/TRDRNA2_136279_c0~~gnl/TRDRNA2_/TRDRNA2_136279_c0_seq1.p1  ORF type:complete len:114 (-),score=14.93 gnl/TRDRNA2_/TRDRNA2_136279_c0_seq1:264-605(-)
MLRVFLCNYRGGSLMYVQYKAAIWWHDERQRKLAMSLKRRIIVAVILWMALSICACVWMFVKYKHLDEKYWSLLIVPVAFFIFPGQLDVLPSCEWHDAEEYHQKYLAKERGRG